MSETASTKLPPRAAASWVQGASGTWMCGAHGLLLRVRPGPDNSPLDGLWTWEVKEVTGRAAEHGIGRGGAETREAAMARAEAAARAHTKGSRLKGGW